MAIWTLQSSTSRTPSSEALGPVIKYGAGADLLIHEVAIVRPELASEAYIQRIMAHHTTAREAGTAFERTTPSSPLTPVTSPAIECRALPWLSPSRRRVAPTPGRWRRSDVI